MLRAQQAGAVIMPVIPAFMISQKRSMISYAVCLPGAGADGIAARKNVSLGGPLVIEEAKA